MFEWLKRIRCKLFHMFSWKLVADDYPWQGFKCTKCGEFYTLYMNAFSD